MDFETRIERGYFRVYSIEYGHFWGSSRIRFGSGGSGGDAGGGGGDAGSSGGDGFSFGGLPGGVSGSASIGLSFGGADTPSVTVGHAALGVVPSGVGGDFGGSFSGTAGSGVIDLGGALGPTYFGMGDFGSASEGTTSSEQSSGNYSLNSLRSEAIDLETGKIYDVTNPRAPVLISPVSISGVLKALPTVGEMLSGPQDWSGVSVRGLSAYYGISEKGVETLARLGLPIFKPADFEAWKERGGTEESYWSEIENIAKTRTGQEMLEYIPSMLKMREMYMAPLEERVAFFSTNEGKATALKSAAGLALLGNTDNPFRGFGHPYLTALGRATFGTVPAIGGYGSERVSHGSISGLYQAFGGPTAGMFMGSGMSGAEIVSLMGKWGVAPDLTPGFAAIYSSLPAYGVTIRPGVDFVPGDRSAMESMYVTQLRGVLPYVQGEWIPIPNPYFTGEWFGIVRRDPQTGMLEAFMPGVLRSDLQAILGSQFGLSPYIWGQALANQIPGITPQQISIILSKPGHVTPTMSPFGADTSYEQAVKGWLASAFSSSEKSKGSSEAPSSSSYSSGGGGGGVEQAKAEPARGGKSVKPITPAEARAYIEYTRMVPRILGEKVGRGTGDFLAYLRGIWWLEKGLPTHVREYVDTYGWEHVEKLAMADRETKSSAYESKPDLRSERGSDLKGDSSSKVEVSTPSQTSYNPPATLPSDSSAKSSPASSIVITPAKPAPYLGYENSSNLVLVTVKSADGTFYTATPEIVRGSLVSWIVLGLKKDSSSPEGWSWTVARVSASDIGDTAKLAANNLAEGINVTRWIPWGKWPAT